MAASEWVIGSGLDCDVWIPETTVSGKHCRLRKTSQGFVLEDLGSTNGTFLNGERLRQATRIEPDSRIMLGGLTPLPWPCVEGASRIVRIGRGAANDFVIASANVSTNHGHIIVGATGTWVIVDLNSTNGIGLKRDSKFQVIRHGALIGPDDTLLLGKYELQVEKIKPLFYSPRDMTAGAGDTLAPVGATTADGPAKTTSADTKPRSTGSGPRRESPGAASPTAPRRKPSEAGRSSPLLSGKFPVAIAATLIAGLIVVAAICYWLVRE